MKKAPVDRWWLSVLRPSPEKREAMLNVSELLVWVAAAAAIGRSPGPAAAWPLIVLGVPIVHFLATGSLPLARVRRRFEPKASRVDFASSEGRSSSQAIDEQWRDTRWTRNTLLVILAVGLVGLSGFAWSQGAWGQVYWAIIGNGLLLAGAAFLVGTVGGFLFGIPRTLQADAAQPVDDARPAAGSSARKTNGDTRYLVNTNLEQISDWLTKIIVGIGLVELRRLPEHLDRLGGFLVEGMKAGSGVQPGEVPFNKAILLSVVIFFVANGFLAGYLMTRLFLAAAFSRADQGLDNFGTLALEARGALAEADRARPIGAKVDSRAVVAEAAVRAPVENLLRRVEEQQLDPSTLDVDQAEAVANAYYHRGQYAAAVPFFNRLRASRRDDVYTALKLAVALGESGRRDEALALLDEVNGLPQPPAETFKLLGYFLMWFPERLEESIRHTTNFLAKVGSDSGAVFNLACAYAQLYGQKQASGDEDSKRQAAEYRRLALQYLANAIETNPRWKSRAESLQAADGDFRALASDGEFQQLIAGV